LSAVSTLQDSLLDHDVRTSPSISASLWFPGGFSLNESYSPRSSADGFGKEYLNTGSISLSNAFDQGITLSGSMNSSATTISTTQGLGGSAQKMFGDLAQVNLRYQWFRYSMAGSGDINRTKSIALDLMMFVTGSLTFWGSYEHTTETSTNGSTLFTELSWKF
jgi:hypothetical protein